MTSKSQYQLQLTECAVIGHDLHEFWWGVQCCQCPYFIPSEFYTNQKVVDTAVKV